MRMLGHIKFFNSAVCFSRLTYQPFVQTLLSATYLSCNYLLLYNFEIPITLMYFQCTHGRENENGATTQKIVEISRNRNYLKKFKGLYSANPWADIAVTLKWSWPQLDMSIVIHIPSWEEISEKKWSSNGLEIFKMPLSGKANKAMTLTWPSPIRHIHIKLWI